MFLFVIAYALLILTACTFLILLHECYNSLATLIPAASFILCMLFYFLIQVVNYNEDQPTSSYYEPIKSELKQSFGLSSTVVSLAFGGLTTTILNVSKHSSAAGNEAHVISKNTEICILVLFFTFMLGFLLMWLSSAPPRVLKRLGTRDLAVKCLKALSYCLLGFLALIAAVAASEFLEGYVVLVLLLMSSSAKLHAPDV
ncbi:hypothetical protein Cni_G12103 [Canna indica]|uniref:Uncharacterized protein n=1 Tax=Canna indica TaxID=4628 RepID=A0AAQ3KA15_9LILI|nr:hypothetical protein Cni_G12103 [Canna indica]